MARVSRKKQNLSTSNVDTAARIWKTALYVRLSVEDNGKNSDSVENQTTLLEEYVAGHPHLERIALFVDNGYTGTDFLRPEFTRMMEAVQAGIVDCVIVKDLSRLGRNYIETSRFIEKVCPFFGLRFIAVNDNYDTATVTNEGQLSASLSNIINDYYAKDISRKVTSALRTKMERGDYIGNYAPHGYQKDPENKNHLIICPETAPVIRQIFELRAGGMSYMGINKKLNDAGIVSPGQYKKNNGIKTNRSNTARTILWNKHMITQILNDIVYIGHLAQRKGSQCLYKGLPYHITDKENWIVVENTHEPLISVELFEKVQEINRQAMETTKANSGKYDYLPKAQNIYGKKFICAECERIMKLTRSINHEKTKAYFTFKCPTFAEHGANGCSDVKMKKEDLDEAVFAFIKSQMEVFMDMEQNLRRLLAMKRSKLKQSGNQQETTAIKQQLEKKRSLLSDLYVDLKAGFLSQDEYGHHKEIITSDIAALELKLAELQSAKIETEEQLTGEMKWKFMVQRFHDATEISADMVEAFVESIKLHEDGTLDIRLSYMDEFASLMATNERLRKEVAA
ncbi:MAG: recombinase family protein [Lachnospiraceae bacterium]|nr:recombinase family protein [Lachnospiraceae bacterium]